ncbi:MAG: YcxB family protein [Bacteroidetes bacterium]|nr:YcxB family protein [Bacteroidota bacterium]
MLQYRFALTPEDFVAYNEYLQLKAPGRRKIMFRLLIPVSIFIIILVAASVFNGVNSGSADFSSYFTIIIYGALIFLSFLSLKSRVRKMALKYASNPQNAAFFNMADYTISATGIHIKDSNKELHYQWNAFTNKVETNQYYYLFVYSNAALIFPKSIFRSEVERNQFTALLSQYLSLQAEVGEV